MARESAAARKRTFLRDAACLATTQPDEQGEARALASVSVPAVAARTGMTRGSVYHLWSTQAQYRLEVTRSMYDQLRCVPMADGAPGPEEHLTEEQSEVEPLVVGLASPPVGEVVVDHMRSLIMEPAFRAGLSFLPFSADAEVRELLHEGEAVMTAQLHRSVTAHLAASAHDDELNWPLERLLAAIDSALQGLCLVHLLGGGTHEGDDADALFDRGRRAVDALILHVTRSPGPGWSPTRPSEPTR